MKKFNVDEFIWLLILILITVYISYLMISGDIYNYLSVKTTKNLYIALVILPIFIIVQLMKVISFNSRKDTSMTVSYTHLTLPTKNSPCRSRWSPYH